jgi:hypothetical protein
MYSHEKYEYSYLYDYSDSKRILKKILFLFALVILAGVISINDAFAELDLADKKLTGNSNNSEFELIFSDGTVSGHLTVENQLIPFENLTVIVKHNNFRIVDKYNDVRIFGKQIGAEKYLVFLKINSDDIQTKLRFIANSNDIKNTIKNTSQRDLLQEIQNKLEKNETKNMTAKELQLMEKQKKVENSLKTGEEALQRIVEKEKNLKTSNSILERINAYKKSTGIIIDNKNTPSSTPAKEPVTQTILSGSKVNVLVSQYERVTKGNSYVFQVKTFDVKKYSGTDWNKFEGKLDGVNISAQIIAPDGQVKEKFSGLTKYGIFEASIPVKDRLWPQGTYTLIVNSEFQGDKTSKTLKFFVVEEGSTSTNHPPISNAGIDQNVVHPVLVTLVGSGSSDPDGDTITYSWVQTSGTSVTLSSSTVSNPTFNTTGPGTLVFQLTVSDGRLTSTDTVTINVS